jgi:hypothetical protein
LAKLSIYLIGSMRNPKIPLIANRLRKHGLDVFDDWHATGPLSDDLWQKYERRRGRSYVDAMRGVHAQNVFQLDKFHLDRCSVAVMVAPAGKSGHLELGYKIGRGDRGYILLDGEPDRFEIMPNFATGIFYNERALVKELKRVAKLHKKKA